MHEGNWQKLIPQELQLSRHITKVITLKKATNSYPQEISGEPEKADFFDEMGEK